MNRQDDLRELIEYDHRNGRTYSHYGVSQDYFDALWHEMSGREAQKGIQQIFLYHAFGRTKIEPYEEKPMSIDAKKIEDKIDSMTALCSDGRKQVKELVKELFPDAKWNTQPEPRNGQVWDFNGEIRLLARNENKYYSLTVQSGVVYNTAKEIENLLTVIQGKFLANSLEEYFDLKRQGKLPK